MKWVLSSCRRYRKSLCLLAGGVLSDQDKVGVENHLAVCAACRNYYNEIKTVTVPLAGWEGHFAHIEPTSEIQNRWAKAIQVAADVNRRGQPVCELTFAATLGNAVRLSFLELVWPCRRIWAGLAVVWVLLLAVNISMNPRSPATMAKDSPAMDVIVTWQQQEQLLAELTGPNEPRAALPPKPYSPQPSSERRFETMAT